MERDPYKLVESVRTREFYHSLDYSEPSLSRMWNATRRWLVTWLNWNRYRALFLSQKEKWTKDYDRRHNKRAWSITMAYFLWHFFSKGIVSYLSEVESKIRWGKVNVIYRYLLSYICFILTLFFIFSKATFILHRTAPKETTNILCEMTSCVFSSCDVKDDST